MGNLFIQCKENKSKLPAEQHRNFQGVVVTNILHSAWAMEHSLHVPALTSPYIGTQPISVNLRILRTQGVKAWKRFARVRD